MSGRRPETQRDITVAIATAGRPEALRRCLDAVERGTVQPVEILVVDQSKDDRTETLIRDLGARAAPIRRIAQEPLGLSASRNAAFTNAVASVVAVTDDDCVPAEDWLTAIDEVLSAPEPAVAVTGRVLPLGSEAEGYAVSSREDVEPKEYRGRQAPWSVGTGANMAVRREWWDRIGGYDLRLGVGTRGAAGEDLDFLHRLLRAGAVVRYEPRALVYHQRQTEMRRRATRSAYGRGVGACCALWLRERDASGLTVLGRWVAMRSGLLAGAARRRDWQRVEEELLVLRGTAAGLAYGTFARSGRAT
jgi:GT2 family glycosyltransferase